VYLLDFNGRQRSCKGALSEGGEGRSRFQKMWAKRAAASVLTRVRRAKCTTQAAAPTTGAKRPVAVEAKRATAALSREGRHTANSGEAARRRATSAANSLISLWTVSSSGIERGGGEGRGGRPDTAAVTSATKRPGSWMDERRQEGGPRCLGAAQREWLHECPRASGRGQQSIDARGIARSRAL